MSESRSSSGLILSAEPSLVRTHTRAAALIGCTFTCALMSTAAAVRRSSGGDGRRMGAAQIKHRHRSHGVSTCGLVHTHTESRCVQRPVVQQTNDSRREKRVRLFTCSAALFPGRHNSEPLQVRLMQNIQNAEYQVLVQVLHRH